MFQYRVEDEIFHSETLKIYSGVIKATKEEIEITAIKRDCYKYDENKIKIEKYLKSLRDILIMIDIFPSKIFPMNNKGEWLVIIEAKNYYNLTDFILNNIESQNNNLLNEIDVLILIYELISAILIFNNYHTNINYQRLIPQNIFISEYNKIYLKFPYWLLLNDSINDMKKLKVNFSESYRYYLPPQFLFDNISESCLSLSCNMDIWSLGCCIAEIFYGVPLFSSINISDQLLKMFQILSYPKWDKIPWKYYKIDRELKQSIEKQQANDNNNNSLSKLINNEAIVELLRCCLEYESEKQISLQQLSVFLDIFEINNKTENKQDSLTFNHINKCLNINNKNKNKSNNKNDLIIIGSSTFINEWSLLSDEIDKKQSEDDRKDEIKDENSKEEKEEKILIEINTNKEQKASQTPEIKTRNISTNTEDINNKIVVNEINNNLNISDCINILPFNDKNKTNENENDKENECNLLILEFSNICNIEKIIETENTKTFSFKYQNDENNNNISSPIFNIDNLKQLKSDKVYIHIIINDGFKKLNELQIILISHSKDSSKKENEIGEIIIDISMLKQYKIIEGYYHIFPMNNSNNNSNNKIKLGQVFVRVLPQFSISNSLNFTNGSQCTESITDDQSVVSNEGWKIFNKFVTNHT